MEDRNIMDEHYDLDTAEIGVPSSLRDRVIIDIKDRLDELYHFDIVVDSAKNIVDQVEG